MKFENKKQKTPENTPTKTKAKKLIDVMLSGIKAMPGIIINNRKLYIKNFICLFIAMLIVLDSGFSFEEFFISFFISKNSALELVT